MITFEEFKTVFSTGIVRNALIVGVLLSITAALLGVVLVLKRYAMIGDGLSHVTFGSMAIAIALHQAPLAFSLPIVVLSAFLMLRLSENSKVTGDATIAVVSTASLAIGAIAARGTNTDIESFMFGSIVSITTSDVILTTVLTLFVIGVYLLFYPRIFAVTFDETYAKASGGKPGLYRAMIAVMTAVIVALGMRLVGSLLISALIIFPVLSAMRLVKSFRSVVIVSAVLSVISFLIALTVSILFSTSTSACIVLADLFIFTLSAVFSKIKSM